MKSILRSISALIGIIVGLAVFATWVSVVGNPHVVETVIGLLLGLAAGFWAYFSVRRYAKQH